MVAPAIDFSFDKPAPSACVNGGVQAVGVYVNDPGGKGVTKAQLDAYLHAGIKVWLIFETTGTDAVSFAQGVADAHETLSLVANLGYPNAVVYFAIDEAIAPDPTDYIMGVASVYGWSRTGVYGGKGTILTIQGINGCKYYWQTYAWSGGVELPNIHLFQHLNGQTFAGCSVDYDTIVNPDFGYLTPSTPNIGSGESSDMFKFSYKGWTGLALPMGNGKYHAVVLGQQDSVSGVPSVSYQWSNAYQQLFDILDNQGNVPKP